MTGEFTALMGPSGAGKTTLMDCIALRQRSFEGAIHVDGKSPKSDYFTQTGKRVCACVCLCVSLMPDAPGTRPGHRLID